MSTPNHYPDLRHGQSQPLNLHVMSILSTRIQKLIILSFCLQMKVLFFERCEVCFVLVLRIFGTRLGNLIIYFFYPSHTCLRNLTNLSFCLQLKFSFIERIEVPRYSFWESSVLILGISVIYSYSILCIVLGISLI